MPPQVPASVARSFEALTPTVIVLLLVSTITMFNGIDVHKIVGSIVAPQYKQQIQSSLLLCNLLSQFWVICIHGWSIVGLAPVLLKKILPYLVNGSNPNITNHSINGLYDCGSGFHRIAILLIHVQKLHMVNLSVRQHLF